MRNYPCWVLFTLKAKDYWYTTYDANKPLKPNQYSRIYPLVFNPPSSSSSTHIAAAQTCGGFGSSCWVKNMLSFFTYKLLIVYLWVYGSLGSHRSRCRSSSHRTTAHSHVQNQLHLSSCFVFWGHVGLLSVARGNGALQRVGFFLA